MKRYALVVGISKYDSYYLENLKKAAVDAEAIAKLLEKHGNFQGVKRLPAKWLTHSCCEVGETKRLTGKTLTDELKYFLTEQAANSEALIYFSGHGIAVFDELDEEQEGFLATSDCEVEKKDRDILSQQNGISLRRLNNLIQKSQVSSLVVILDCCHAGSMLETQLVTNTLTTFNSSSKDYFLLAACRPKESAYEGEKYSFFTQALLNGLQESQAGSDGKIICDRAFAVINEELKRSGQEPIRMGWGRPITLVQYDPSVVNKPIISQETKKLKGLFDELNITINQKIQDIKQPNLLENTDELVQFKNDIQESMLKIQEIERRDRMARIAAEWLKENKYTIVESLTKCTLIKNNEDVQDKDIIYKYTPNEIQSFQEEISNYIDWLSDSLIYGEPIDKQLEKPIALPQKVYIEAFKFMKKQWGVNRFSDGVVEEFEPYLDYLVSYLSR